MMTTVEEVSTPHHIDAAHEFSQRCRYKKKDVETSAPRKVHYVDSATEYADCESQAIRIPLTRYIS